MTNAESRGAWVILVCAPILGSLGCRAEPEDSSTGLSASNLSAPGALVDVSMRSRVAVVLDEIPTPWRARAASYYLGQPRSFWLNRAKHQIKHTNYRLTYRNFFYSAGNRQMLALPPETLWQIDFESPVRRVTTADGHDAVEVRYVLRTTLLTDPKSPGEAEPRLRRVGGVWHEPFHLPLDPEYVFQRTGYACLDEDGYPVGTARSENAAQLFDHDCDVETEETASCHLTELPTESCLDALARATGRVDTHLRFERVAYTQTAAARVRVGDFTHLDAPDLAVVPEQLGNNWIEYRYIPEDSCAIEEQCVGGAGWRRLLLFDASIKNAGARPLVVGSTDEDSPARLNNLFEFSACHEHFHFRHYGDFGFGPTPGDKRAFCVESTDRYYNNEGTPLVHEFSCDYQGVAPGWGDTYIAGVECNWIDITDVTTPNQPTTANLRFELNPDGFLCEGAPVLDASGNPVYEPTAFLTELGEPVHRPVCAFTPGYATNNFGTRSVTLPPSGSLVTAPCQRKQAGPLRDCGFSPRSENQPCTAGASTTLMCRVAANRPPQVLRVCENSASLGGIPCMYADALGSQVVTAIPSRVTFACPESRGADAPGGSYSLYVAPLLPTDAQANVTCRLSAEGE